MKVVTRDELAAMPAGVQFSRSGDKKVYTKGKTITESDEYAKWQEIEFSDHEGTYIDKEPQTDTYVVYSDEGV